MFLPLTPGRFSRTDLVVRPTDSFLGSGRNGSQSLILLATLPLQHWSVDSKRSISPDLVCESGKNPKNFHIDRFSEKEFAVRLLNS